ncbi:MAG TPA: GNAT family N-acetyltransferase [Puia sp.]|nr:GNAT family N-acetyltransferase [Puia sp.]
MNSQIRYIRHNKIDKSKWDAAISSASNGLIYAYSFYLDFMAKNWDALVLDDYRSVMPLTWNKKFGIHYLYQPPFTASLGVFGDNSLPGLAEEFIRAIPKKFKLIEIALNAANQVQSPGHQVTLRNNFVLPLSPGYPSLATGYRENIRRNIRKAEQLGCIAKKGIAIHAVIDLAKLILARVSNIREPDYANLSKLYHFLEPRGDAETWGVFSASGELLASCLYFFSHRRAYYILVGNHPNGRTLGASHYLIDCFIRDRAGQDLLLDFEGSDIRNLAFFYASFGAVQENYPFLKINRLPFWIRWTKS